MEQFVNYSVSVVVLHTTLTSFRPQLSTAYPVLWHFLDTVVTIKNFV